MPHSLFDFEVFLSFASADTEAAKEIWRLLNQGGLRVFWSTDTLKEAIGQSFIEAIQDSLLKSQHFVLFWTAQAKRSGWVKAEYEAFYSQCHVKDQGSRRLVVLPDGLESISSLPPFLRSLQIARSAPEVVTLLGGVDPQRLQRENRELSQQVNRLRAENLEFRAAGERLEARLDTVQKELDLTKRRPVESPTSRPHSESAAEPTPARMDELLAAEEALRQIEVEFGGGMGGPWINETGALQSWKALYAQGGKQAIQSLLSLLVSPKRAWQDQWKAISLLTYASRTPEGRERAGEIIASVADLVLRGGYVGKAAMDLIVVVPAPLRNKWEILFPILQAAPVEKIGEVVRCLPELTPVEERGRTAEVIAEILAFTTQAGLISATVNALKALSARSELPRLREALAEAPVEKANSLADLLAYFGDRDSVPAIRQAIETWRYGAKSIRSLVLSLQLLAGPASHLYLVELLSDSHPQLQREILSGVLSRSEDLAVLAAVGRLAESAADPGVKELAGKYIAAGLKS